VAQPEGAGDSVGISEIVQQNATGHSMSLRASACFVRDVLWPTRVDSEIKATPAVREHPGVTPEAFDCSRPLGLCRAGIAAAITSHSSRSPIRSARLWWRFRHSLARRFWAAVHCDVMAVVMGRRMSVTGPKPVKERPPPRPSIPVGQGCCDFVTERVVIAAGVCRL
jgi:hypothetical protein